MCTCMERFKNSLELALTEEGTLLLNMLEGESGKPCFRRKKCEETGCNRLKETEENVGTERRSPQSTNGVGSTNLMDVLQVIKREEAVMVVGNWGAVHKHLEGMGAHVDMSAYASRKTGRRCRKVCC
eukprot:TRINITY_DN20917_c0_g1_i1.p1 TRINITY_DN20917_c0_g1~~TRINITY_DN20917_c0_g1_i1.p1  ORF type:complete len:127 (+),score=22.37 TRINITY_DN20917_c0_g1_i1:373-753(+)